nr:hypothetical protein CFP56_24433 [Quercus suber]
MSVPRQSRTYLCPSGAGLARHGHSYDNSCIGLDSDFTTGSGVGGVIEYPVSIPLSSHPYACMADNAVAGAGLRDDKGSDEAWRLVSLCLGKTKGLVAGKTRLRYSWFCQECSWLELEQNCREASMFSMVVELASRIVQ